MQTLVESSLNNVILQAALFVDFENLVFGISDAGYPKPVDQAIELIRSLQERLKTEGLATSSGLAYANWGFSELFYRSLNRLNMLGIRPQYVCGRRGRNTADLELSLDAQEILMNRSHINVFVIVGGDRDYLPIARRIKNAGKRVIVVSTSESMSDALSLFIGPSNFIDAVDLIGQPPERLEDKEKAAKEILKSPPKKIVPATNLSLEERGIKLLLDVGERYTTEEIWLAPLLKNEAVEAFPELFHEERKELIQTLEAEGIIRFEQREDPLRQIKYTVVLIQRTHPLVSKFTESKTESTDLEENV